MHKLLVIGVKSKTDDVLDGVASALGSGNGMDFCVRRCASPGELPELVATVAKQYGQIEVLELFDHGDRGLIRMGKGDLFKSDDDPSTPLLNWEIARKLSCSLSRVAHVRLLGCDTTGAKKSPLAYGDEGRLLLLKLQQELQAERVVFGTLAEIDAGRFDENGFTSDIALLYSSLAALDFSPLKDLSLRDKSIEKYITNYSNRPSDRPCLPRTRLREQLRIAGSRAALALIHCIKECRSKRSESRG